MYCVNLIRQNFSDLKINCYCLHWSIVYISGCRTLYIHGPDWNCGVCWHNFKLVFNNLGSIFAIWPIWPQNLLNVKKHRKIKNITSSFNQKKICEGLLPPFLFFWSQKWFLEFGTWIKVSYAPLMWPIFGSFRKSANFNIS